MTLLVATAVAAEADAIRAALPPDDTARQPGSGHRAAREPGHRPERPGSRNDRPHAVHIGSFRVAAVGVGPAAAAAGTARLLALAEAAGTPYTAVLSAGIAGGFPGRTRTGATVLASRTIAADLGAESPTGFLSVDELGFGSATIQVDAGLLAALRGALPGASVGDLLTVSTVTGAAESAATLAARFPHALAEAMEGYGVGCAALGAGLPFAELRTISNPIGPRDRDSWQIGAALSALSAAIRALRAG